MGNVIQRSLPYSVISLIKIYSNRVKRPYEVHRFMEYSIDIDLEMDSDQFNMVVEDARGTYTGVFNKFDPITIWINGKGVLKGMVDEIEYVGDNDNRCMRIAGRDFMWVLVDNDAEVATLNNVVPKSYISNIAKKYGIENCVINTTAKTVDKLSIGCGESELPIIEKLISPKHEKVWSIFDTMYVGKWNTGGKPTFTITRGVTQEKAGIMAKSVSLRIGGQNNFSSYSIHGENDDGKDKLLGSYKNDKLPITRNRVVQDSDVNTVSEATKLAERELRESVRKDVALTVTIQTLHYTPLPNMVFRLIDNYQLIDSTFFITCVTYTKSLNEGSICTIKAIPTDETLHKLMNGEYLIGLRE